MIKKDTISKKLCHKFIQLGTTLPSAHFAPSHLRGWDHPLDTLQWLAPAPSSADCRNAIIGQTNLALIIALVLLNIYIISS